MTTKPIPAIRFQGKWLFSGRLPENSLLMKTKISGVAFLKKAAPFKAFCKKLRQKLL
ncbi:hypothetical protein [Novacetimonas cocois]|uniref:hypothetical protein n=1 Tax=Novacetimonas cocois TaxID=1747507 RepID=UPI0014038ECD|nr:hypothetical protein [Novacetimonas cocois]